MDSFMLVKADQASFSKYFLGIFFKPHYKSPSPQNSCQYSFTSKFLFLFNIGSAPQLVKQVGAATAPAKEAVYEEASKNPPKDQLHLKKLSDYKTLSKVPPHILQCSSGDF